MSLYQDFSSLPVVRAAPLLADCYGLSYPAARAVIAACIQARLDGAAGRPLSMPALASRDLADLVKDAWHDGCVGRKLVVRLVSRACQACPAEDDHTECEECCGTGRDSCADADVSAPFAHEWADWDGYIGGSSWETPSDMPGFAYASPCDHPGLVAELRKEGYTLDLSDYDAW